MTHRPMIIRDPVEYDPARPWRVICHNTFRGKTECCCATPPGGKRFPDWQMALRYALRRASLWNSPRSCAHKTRYIVSTVRNGFRVVKEFCNRCGTEISKTGKMS